MVFRSANKNPERRSCLRVGARCEGSARMDVSRAGAGRQARRAITYHLAEYLGHSTPPSTNGDDATIDRRARSTPGRRHAPAYRPCSASARCWSYHLHPSIREPAPARCRARLVAVSACVHPPRARGEVCRCRLKRPRRQAPVAVDAQRHARRRWRARSRRNPKPPDHPGRCTKTNFRHLLGRAQSLRTSRLGM